MPRYGHAFEPVPLITGMDPAKVDGGARRKTLQKSKGDDGVPDWADDSRRPER